MAGKRKAKIAYYEGVKEALGDHMRTTETGIRNLPRLTATEKDKLIAAVRKHHKKLLKQVDQNLANEMNEEFQSNVALGREAAGNVVFAKERSGALTAKTGSTAVLRGGTA